MKQRTRQSGFTLVELLLYIAVSAGILLVSSAFLGLLLQSRVKNQTIAEVEQQGLQVAQVITQTARNAESITSPAPASSSSSLTLDVVTGANDPTVFDVSGGVMRQTQGAGSAVALTNSRVTVSGVSFENVTRGSTPGSIRITFTVTHVNPSGRNEYDFAKTFVTSASLR